MRIDMSDDCLTDLYGLDGRSTHHEPNTPARTMSIARNEPVTNRPSTGQPLEEASTILLLASALDPLAEEACSNLLTLAPGRGRDRVLAISFTKTADDRLTTWEACDAGHVPAEVGVVGGPEVVPADTTCDDHDVEISIATVDHPGNLTQLGVAISEYLDAWDDGDGLAVCFHSLTTLLQYADRDCVFRFLNVLTRELADADAVAHFHMDPRAHDGETLATLVSVFDAVIETDGGEWTVSTPA